MKQNYFTLLEVILVLFIMGLIASAGLMVVETTDDQERYDETKRRLEMIRYALEGNQLLQTNNQPMISGYIVDTGKVPISADDLLNNNTGVQSYAYDDRYGFSWGWRGPYISTFDESFKDGWDYDWGDSGDFANDNGDLTIKSLGKKNADGGTEYERDISVKILKSRYKILKTNFSFQVELNDVVAPETSSEQLKKDDKVRLLILQAALVRPIDDQWDNGFLGDVDGYDEVGGEATPLISDDFTLPDDLTSVTANFTFNGNHAVENKIPLSLGRCRFVLLKKNNITLKYEPLDNEYYHIIINPLQTSTFETITMEFDLQP